MVLVTNSNIEPYVPVLHGNTSSLEAWFSCMRGNNCNTIQTYRSGAGAVDASNAITFLQNNKAYDASDIANEEADKMLSTGVFQSVEKHRQKYLDNWLAAIDEEKKNNNDQSVLPYGTEFYGGASRKGIELFNKLCSKKPKGHFVYIIAAEEQFRQWVRLSFQSPEQVWFDAMIKFSEEDNKKFDQSCQLLLRKIFNFTLQYLQQTQNACSCLELELYNFIASKEFVDSCKNLPSSMQPHRQICCVALLLSLSRLHSVWIYDLLSHNEKLNNTNGVTEANVDVSGEVVNFVGWAISDLLKQLRGKKMAKSNAWNV